MTSLEGRLKGLWMGTERKVRIASNLCLRLAKWGVHVPPCRRQFQGNRDSHTRKIISGIRGRRFVPVRICLPMNSSTLITAVLGAFAWSCGMFADDSGVSFDPLCSAPNSAAVAMQSGREWSAKAVAIEVNDASRLDLSFAVYGDSKNSASQQADAIPCPAGTMHERLSFFLTFTGEGSYPLEQDDASYHTDINEDVGGIRYLLAEDAENVVTISLFSPDEGAVRGVFAATFVKDSSEYSQTPAPDTLKFEEGSFNVRLFDVSAFEN